MAKRNQSTDKLVVVNPDGSRHIVPAANERNMKAYNSKLSRDQQFAIYPFEEGKAVEDYGKGTKSKTENPDTANMIQSLVAKMDEQEKELQKLRAQAAEKQIIKPLGKKSASK